MWCVTLLLSRKVASHKDIFPKMLDVFMVTQDPLPMGICPYHLAMCYGFLELRFPMLKNDPNAITCMY